MGKLFVALFWLLCWACSSGSSNIDAVVVPPENYQTPTYQIFMGETHLLRLPLSPALTLSKLICRNQEVPFYIHEDQVISFVSESYFSDLTNFSCRFVFADGQERVAVTFQVLTKEYPQEHLKVAPSKVVPSVTDQKRIDKEQKMLNALYKNYLPAPIFGKPFQRPLESVITSSYGHRRVFNRQKMGQHLGVDFRAPVGTKIYPANQGRVVFVGDLFYTGNTVILDHGLGVFTVYAHLSTTAVKTGEMIDVSTNLGTAGMTGRASGPHLHWGVKINGQWINGLSLIKETQDWAIAENSVQKR